MLPQLNEDLEKVMAGGKGGKQCLFVQVKIKIVSTRVSASNMYSKELMSSDQPMLVKCNPDDSPQFIHGRV